MNRRTAAPALAALLALAAAVTAAAADADLGGSWTLEIPSPQGKRSPSMVLTQLAGKVTGTYKGMRGEAPVSGTISGRDFDLTVKISGADATLVVQYKGQVSGDALSGRVLMGSLGEAAFTGKRTR